MGDNLVSWLIEELDGRGWSQRELARRAGVSHTTISQVIAEVRQPTWDFSASIAKALGEPVDRVFVLAGLKRPLPPPVEEEQEALGILRGLSASVRSTAMTMLRALAREEGGTVSAEVYEGTTSYLVDEEPWVREVVEEIRQVPEEWRPEALRQMTFLARMGRRPAARLVGEEDIEKERATGP